MSRLVGRGLACRRGERLVFEGVDLALEPGGLLRLVGPNGSGKSSLLRLLAGLLPAAAGTLLWDEEPAGHAESYRRGARFLGHLDALKPVLSLRENLVAAAGLLEIAAPRVEAALESLGLVELAELPVRFLSAGQRRRAALARLALAPAALWLLDEPTVNLDAGASRAFEVLLDRHLESGGMAVIATHELARAERGQLIRLGDA